MLKYLINIISRMVVSALLLTPIVTFASQLSNDVDIRFEKYYINYTINKDGSFIEERTWSMKLINERALKSVKETSITYSTSIQTAEIIEAYTLKANGKKILVPKDSYQITVNGGKDQNKALFSDRTTIRLVFPEVDLGDSVFLNYKLVAKEAIFPNEFSEAQIFFKGDAYDDVRISIDAPGTLKLYTQLREFKEIKNMTKNNRHIINWSWKNSEPIIDERKDYSVFNGDEDPGYIISTFNTQEEIAKAYGIRATPKATPTEKVKKLADKITKDKKTNDDIVHSLYDWVATNITYAGNCVGLGAVVPHDLDFIIDNKMGDCKDHATLLQSLLLAKNIRSTQALINSGAAYELPKIPVVSMVNHVINYIPSMDLFLDSTSNSTPYGMLPRGDEEKFVLLVEDFKNGFKTPSQKPGVNTQNIKSSATIDADGSLHGDSKVSLTGSFSEYARSSMREVSKDKEKDLIKSNFKKSAEDAKGTFEHDDAKPLLKTYNYSAKYDVKNFYTFAKSGAVELYPHFFNFAPIVSFLSESKVENPTNKIACSSGKSSEEFEYTFPDNIQIVSFPDDMQISNKTISYSAHYKLEKNKMTVKRILDDRTVGNVCSPETIIEDKKILQQAYDNYNEQLIYKMLKN